MTGQERKEKILAILEESKTVTVSLLADEFKVSEKTIRRDLTALEEKELLVRTRGGAVLPDAVEETAEQMELELPVESSVETSKKDTPQAASANEFAVTSEQIHPGVVVKTSRPEWIVRAIEKARPGTIKEPTPTVKEKEEPPVQKKKDEPTKKAPESTPEEVEPPATEETKEPEKSSKEINVIEVGEAITPEVLEGLIKYVNPKSQEESIASSKQEEQVSQQEQSKEKLIKDKQREDKPREDKAKEEKREKDKSREEKSKEERPVKDKPKKDKAKEEKLEKAKSASPDKKEKSQPQKKSSKKARADKHKKANRQDGTVKSIRKNQKQKSEEPKESSKLRSVFDLIHIILAVICFIGGTILAIYILQTNRNQNVEIEEDNGRHETIICEDLSVNSSEGEQMLVSVSDDTVIRVYL